MKDYYLFSGYGPSIRFHKIGHLIEVEHNNDYEGGVTSCHEPYKLIQQLRETADYLEKHGTDTKTGLQKEKETGRTTQSRTTPSGSDRTRCTLCGNLDSSALCRCLDCDDN